jgi:hypothetical protein
LRASSLDEGLRLDTDVVASLFHAVHEWAGQIGVGVFAAGSRGPRDTIEGLDEQVANALAPVADLEQVELTMAEARGAAGIACMTVTSLWRRRPSSRRASGEGCPDARHRLGGDGRREALAVESGQSHLQEARPASADTTLNTDPAIGRADDVVLSRQRPVK